MNTISKEAVDEITKNFKRADAYLESANANTVVEYRTMCAALARAHQEQARLLIELAAQDQP